MTQEIAYSVLLLDDESDVIESLVPALKRKGFITWASQNQEEAMRFVESHRPSVALIDLHMPEINGIEVIKRMRKIIPDIRVVVVTGQLGKYQEEVKPLNVRVVEKGIRTHRELERVICEELELSRQQFEDLKKREKPKLRARILVVDDETEIADFVADIIKEEGLEAESAHSADEALMKAEAFKPDILLTDLQMRKVDGDELIRRMKASGNHTYIKLYVGMTGAADQQHRFVQSGTHEVLLKPFGLTEFLTAMKKWAEVVSS